MKKIVALAFAIMVSTSVFAEKTIVPKPNHVLGKVNGEKFYMRDWSAEFESLDQNVKSKGTDALLIPLRDAIINKVAMSHQALKQGLHKTDTYKAEIAKAKRDILTRLYLDGKAPKAISDKKAKAEYKRFKKEFQAQNEVSASHILLKNRKDADLVIKALDSGQDFAELAKKKSTGPSGADGGKLGFFNKGQMVPKFEKAVYKLKEGQYTKRPVKTKFGWHVIKRGKSRKQKIPAFSKIEDEIKQNLYQRELAKIVEKAIKKSKITLYDLKGKKIK